MATVEDVGAAILEEIGHSIDTKRLQKLVYFSQVVYLAWYGRPFFDDDVQAFGDGPVVYRLFKLHQGAFKVGKLPEGNPADIDEEGKCVVSFVCGMYGNTPGEQLGKLTHSEGPWRTVREKAGLKDGQWGTPTIPKRMLREYGRSKSEFMDQAWYWTPEWQAGERAAEEELLRGEGSLYMSDEDFKEALS